MQLRVSTFLLNVPYIPVAMIGRPRLQHLPLPLSSTEDFFLVYFPGQNRTDRDTISDSTLSP